MYGGTQAERLKKEEEAAKKAAAKAATKARKAEKKSRKPEEQNVEASATIGAEPAKAGKDAVDGITDGVQQVTLPTS